MNPSFSEKFKRVTDNHSYLPEIDGLRFLAVFLVVVVMHITHYIDEKFFHNQLIQSLYWKDFVMEGNNGVSLFFVISGFILSLPFAKWHMLKSKRVELKHYYIRRVLRIEPPYLIVLFLAFAAHAMFLHIYSLPLLKSSLLASIFYVHTMVYQDFPYILPVAWSLEIEVQFYLLAPLFCLIFLIRSSLLRRSILLAVMIGNVFFVYNGQVFGNVFVFIHFFACGLLLADLYTNGIIIFRNEKLGFMLGIAALASLFFIASIGNMTGYLIKLVSIFLLMHIVLTNPMWKRLISFRLITIIGGMCYSIYLIHFAVISIVGKILLKYSLGIADRFYFIPYMIIFIVCILFMSGVYFLLVEKPFMKLGTWGRRSVLKKEKEVTAV